jgi:hypothetical protein
MPGRARFPAPVQAGSGVHPASCTMGTGSFPGVKRPGRGVYHPLPSSAEVKLRVELYRGAGKSLARPGRKQATATEDFGVHISYL